MTRVTATMLETYRRFRQTEYTSYDDVVASIMGVTTETEAMRLGTAVHAVLEQMHTGDASFNEWALYEQDGFTFDGDSIRTAADFLTPMWMREVMAEKVIKVGAADVVLRCKADALIGTVIVDHKVTTNAIDERKVTGYQDSMQWRAYLYAFGGHTFGYNAMQWVEWDGLWQLKQRDFIACDRYKGIDAEVVQAVHELYDFARHNGLESYLTKTYMEAA